MPNQTSATSHPPYRQSLRHRTTVARREKHLYFPLPIQPTLVSVGGVQAVATDNWDLPGTSFERRRRGMEARSMSARGSRIWNDSGRESTFGNRVGDDARHAMVLGIGRPAKRETFTFVSRR